jgi:hypothetical protein
MTPAELSLRLTVVTPCKVKWKDMQGDDKVRQCALCQLDVYNVAELSKLELEALLSSSGRTCVQVVRRRDGTVVMGDCRRIWIERRARARRTVSQPRTMFAAISAIAVLLVAALILAVQALRVRTRELGGIGGPEMLRQVTPQEQAKLEAEANRRAARFSAQAR